MARRCERNHRGNAIRTTLVFDIETNGLIPEMTTIHSLVIKNPDTQQVWSLSNEGGDYGQRLAHGLKLLEEADVIVGHNIVDFDIPAIQKLYPWFQPKGTIRDTIVMSRLMWANMTESDFLQEKKLGLGRWIEKKLFGRHSLESWGQRLGIWKGDYGKIKEEEGKALGLKGDALVAYVWGQWSQEMQDYCEQDVEVTTKLWQKVNAKGFSEESINLEHDVRRIISRQERYGFQFDEKGAVTLYGVLTQERSDLEKKLTEVFPPLVVEEEFIPKANNSKLGYVKGEPFIKRKEVPFNPSSRFHIADRLKMKGWVPTEFTADGHPKVDDEVLASLPYEEAKPLARYLLIQKRIGQLAEGKEAWLKHVRNGRIHGSVNTNGAVTGRMTHSRPNLAQVPSSGAEFGHACRALFIVALGKKLVGADADALELRDLAGYMAIYDGGAYIKTVLEGKKEDGTDMHTQNAQALGCDRNTAKVWFYAFIYGAGDFKLGSILGVQGSKKKITLAGTESRAKFLAALPALKKLVEAVKKKAKLNGTLKGLDGRILTVRSEHAALNTLLQSAGAIQMKRALVILDNNLQANGWIPGTHYEFVGNIHDEWQIEADEDKAELVGKMAADAIRLAGEYYNFRCALAGNAVVGENWSQTH